MFGSGPVGTPFATLTKMGWTLNGSASDNISSRRVTSHLITASVHDVSEHRQDEDKDITYVQENTLKMSIEATVSDVTDNLYAALNIIVILLCLMWLVLGSIISLCTYCSYDFIVVHVSLLEASYASMGGVPANSSVPKLKRSSADFRMLFQTSQKLNRICSNILAQLCDRNYWTVSVPTFSILIWFR